MPRSTVILLVALVASFSPAATGQACGDRTGGTGTVPSFVLSLGSPTSGSRDPDPIAEATGLVAETIDVLEAYARDNWVFVDDDIPFIDFDRSNIEAVIISQVSGFQFNLFFRAGSHVEEPLAAELLNIPPGSLISGADGAEYPIEVIGCVMGNPPATGSPTMSPTASPTRSS